MINLKNILQENHQESKNELDYFNNIMLRDQEDWTKEFYNNNTYFNPEQDEWQIKLINKNPFSIKDIDNPSDIIIKYAIDKNVEVIPFIMPNKMSLDVFLHIIGKDPKLLKLIREPSKAMLKYVLRNYYYGQEYLKNPKQFNWDYILTHEKFGFL